MLFTFFLKRPVLFLGATKKTGFLENTKHTDNLLFFIDFHYEKLWILNGFQLFLGKSFFLLGGDFLPPASGSVDQPASLF